MKSSKLIVRVCALAGLAGLLVITVSFLSRREVRAAPASAALFQDTPGYAVPTEDNSGSDTGYNAPATDTPSFISTIEDTPTLATTPSAVLTETFTPTLPPDLFRTEDSEINNAKTTPVTTDTPGPTITPVRSPTVAKTQSQSSPTPAAVKKKGGITLDWGLFWIGFSLPVLAACGVVLYMLDRQPGLFKRSR